MNTRTLTPLEDMRPDAIKPRQNTLMQEYPPGKNVIGMSYSHYREGESLPPANSPANNVL